MDKHDAHAAIAKRMRRFDYSGLFSYSHRQTHGGSKEMSVSSTRNASALCAAAASIMFAALAPPAFAMSQEIPFLFENNLRNKIEVRGMIANQNKIIWMKTGQVQPIHSTFSSNSASIAIHDVRFEALASPTPRYCKWTVRIDYNADRHPKWFCSVSDLQSQDGAICTGYSRNGYGEVCSFYFTLK